MEIFRSNSNGLPSICVGGDVISIRHSGFTISAEIHCGGRILNIYRINQGRYSRTSLHCFADLFSVLVQYLEAKEAGIFPDYERYPSKYQVSLAYYRPEIYKLDELFDVEVKEWIHQNAGFIQDVFTEITSILEGE